MFKLLEKMSQQLRTSIFNLPNTSQIVKSSNRLFVVFCKMIHSSPFKIFLSSSEKCRIGSNLNLTKNHYDTFDNVQICPLAVLIFQEISFFGAV